MKNFTEQIQQSVNSANAEYEKKVAQLFFNNQKFTEKLSLLERKLFQIHSALESEGLGLENLTYAKTGIGEDWTEETQLSVCFNGVPLNGKVKFLTFNGYTSTGRGKNQDRLKEKADKLTTSLKEKANLENCSVNPYSLEVKDNSSSKRVMYSIWL